MNKNSLVVILVLVLGGAVVGGVLLLRSSNPKVETTTTVIIPTATPVVEATSEAKTFIVEGSSFKFVPNVIKVKKGDKVQIVFKDSEGIHDFVIDEFGIKTKGEAEFVADKIGTFEYYCSVGNHRKMGMVGKLIVE